ncbi:hypothetical protein [Flavobacterium subsaxonicum]|uniref:Uncharacterized protein n=1 Tax=Flavobacterium subsaxonicum WB 4.1-42 = DSM 21790 TaxID=1121898 RepID=A0A0A2MI47_9FLAO|nr:hypothetical protein [Flavobacterium subsaxonicum]KGO91241.1 hypothetical protein Q766_18975 [Flavobacterium subsaxonicum WB 4.1-42 = DSM 21790]
MHEAELYNKTKAIVFSILNRDDVLPAYKMLENYRSKLPIQGWYGLKAELDFYTKYKDKYTLDPTFDFGIKCDFSGNIDGDNNCRIDITTNLDYKKLENYDAIQRKDKRKYKIVVMDKNTGEIADIFDLNFPIDSSGEGRIFEVAIFMPSSSGSDGLKYDFYQDIIQLSSSDPEDDSILKETCTDWYIPDFEYMLSNLPEDADSSQEILKRSISSAKVLDKSTSSNIVACGQRFYDIFDPHTGDGEWITKIYWKHPVIENYIDDYIDVDLSVLY